MPPNRLAERVDLPPDPVSDQVEAVDRVGIRAQAERDASARGDDRRPQRVPMRDLGQRVQLEQRHAQHQLGTGRARGRSRR